MQAAVILHASCTDFQLYSPPRAKVCCQSNITLHINVSDFCSFTPRCIPPLPSSSIPPSTRSPPVFLPSSSSSLPGVCAGGVFPLRLQGGTALFLSSSLVLHSSVFRAAKASSSCLQQGVCSVSVP
ncbi:hypothetical protein EYF80_031497 [Liparis tanakae]|uniref:Uncharacterized protein n=1 Tax=Liparis tanakae TaxID=230148 RepID=A0A4Z2GX79_9TELE|nr:hypothetical protein EYF80_031497 [Liparis tanakae]